MALRSEMEDAVELRRAHHSRYRVVIHQVAEVESDFAVGRVGDHVADIFLASVGGAHKAVHLVSFGRQQVGQVRPHKSRDACNQIAHLFR